MNTASASKRPSKAHLFPSIDGFGDIDNLADGLADTWREYEGAGLKASINCALALKKLRRRW